MADAIPSPPTPDVFQGNPSLLTAGQPQPVSASALQPPTPQQQYNPVAGLQQAFKQYETGQAQQEKLKQQLLQNPMVQKKIDEANAPESSMPQAPATEYKNSLNVFKDLLPSLAVLGGSFTRAPLMTALNAGTGAMEGFNQGQQAQAEAKMQEFKQKLEAWKEKHNQLKDLRASIVDKDGNVNWGTLASYAAADGNSALLAALQTNPQQAFEMYSKYMKAAGEAEKIPLELEELQTRIARNKRTSELGGKKSLEAILANPDSTDADREFARKELADISKAEKATGGTLTDEDYEKTYKNDPLTLERAQAYHSGATPQQLVGGRSNSPEREAFQRKAQELWPDFNWAEAHIQYLAKAAGEKSTEQLASKLNFASNLLDQSLPSMMAAAKKLGLSNSTDINSLVNAARAHMSNTDYNNFRTQVRAVASDYAQFIGRGAGTVHSDEEAMKILSDNMGEGGLQGFVDGIKAERENVKAASKISKEEQAGKGAATPKATYNYNQATSKFEEIK